MEAISLFFRKSKLLDYTLFMRMSGRQMRNVLDAIIRTMLKGQPLRIRISPDV